MWDTILKIALGAVAVGAAAFATVKIYQKITGESLVDEVKGKFGSKAMKLLIKSKKTKSVNVGIFDNKNTEFDQMEIESDKGVASDLKVGQVIYC